MAIPVTVFTDPYCPWSWGAEPSLRRLEVEFGDQVAVTFVIAGLAARIEDPGAMALAALDAAAASGMPLDARVWLDDPPASTHPAGLALKAAEEQGAVGRYLRRLREAILLERRRMDSAGALLDAAREAGGLDLERLRSAFGSSAVVEAFGADLERARAADPAHHAPGTGRVALPALEATGPDGAVHGAYGPAPYEVWRDAVVAAGGAPAGERPGVEAALRRWGALATPEVAAACDLPGPRAPAALWAAALEWRVRPRPVPGGELWSLA